MPVIETRRLRLRGFTNDDLDALAEIYADPDVMRYGAMRPAARWSVRGVDVAEPGAAAGLCRTGWQGAPVWGRRV